MKNYYLLRGFNQPICADNSPSTVGENYTKKEVHIKCVMGIALHRYLHAKDPKKYPIMHATHTLQLYLMVLISLRKVSVQVKP
jgi:hypothetical protein